MRAFCSAVHVGEKSWPKIRLWRRPPYSAVVEAIRARQRGGASYPRKTLVSDFVAQKTGELFLFVNDALPLAYFPDDTHYRNNSGSARITLTRAPLPPASGRVAKE
jgi:hypothetical protein